MAIPAFAEIVISAGLVAVPAFAEIVVRTSCTGWRWSTWRRRGQKVLMDHPRPRPLFLPPAALGIVSINATGITMAALSVPQREKLAAQSPRIELRPAQLARVAVQNPWAINRTTVQRWPPHRNQSSLSPPVPHFPTSEDDNKYPKLWVAIHFPTSEDTCTPVVPDAPPAEMRQRISAGGASGAQSGGATERQQSEGTGD